MSRWKIVDRIVPSIGFFSDRYKYQVHIRLILDNFVINFKFKKRVVIRLKLNNDYFLF